MEFCVLGPLELIVGGTSVGLTARRQRALVAALLLRAGEAVSSEALIEALWGSGPPDSAASLLRLYVSQVRRCLPPGRLVTRRPGYTLVVEAGELDAERFEGLFAEGRRARAEGNPRLAQSLHCRALALWRGAALADLRAESFAREEASRLDELRLQCIEERIAAELELGRHSEVLAELELLVAENRLRDLLRGQLMLALYRAGRQADALACYRSGREALVEELGLEPGTELRELERLILRQDPSLQLAPTNGSLAERRRVTAPPTATIGRDRAIAEVRRLLLSGRSRLVTLVGPGGVGKTRLAVESAALVGEELVDGAILVELAALRDPDLLLASIGQALGLREAGGSSWAERLGEHLRSLELLLVLDNLEHLVEGVAPLVQLLAVAPRLRVLATSTTVLRLSAEHVLIVPPLERPAAFELFMRQTIAAGAPAAMLASSRETLAQVCDRLDGSPLAIELAAPWLRALSPAELLKLLDSRLAALRNGPRDAPARHRTLRSTIDWSFDLLAAEDQRLFAQLSVFAGGFSLEAVAAVAGSDATIERLESLVAASLVHATDDRYHLLEVVREYAAERLGDDVEPRRRHAEHFASLVVAAEQRLSGSDQAEWLRRLDAEHDNLRAALDWLATDQNTNGAELRLAAGLGRFWYVRGHIREGLTRLRHAIDGGPHDDGPSLAKALRAASALAVIQGDYSLARELANRSLLTYRKLGDRAGAARSLSNLGAILHAQGELELAAATLDECIRDCLDLHEDRLLALAQNNRGDVALSQRELNTAAAHFERSLAILRTLGDTANVARSLYNLGAVAVEQNRLDDARTLLGESIALSERVGDSEDVAWCLIALAATASRSAQPLYGARMLGFAIALLDRIGATMKPFEQNLYARTRDALHTALGATQLETALAEGARLRLPSAIKLASTLEATDPLTSQRRPTAGAPSG
jgi:predicted ATPase/DNA-binding SARP family transcriptional activator